jgi:hypothetical protein
MNPKLQLFFFPFPASDRYTTQHNTTRKDITELCSLLYHYVRWPRAVLRYSCECFTSGTWCSAAPVGLYLYFLFVHYICPTLAQYRGADKSLARPTSRCILFDGENISFDASLVIYINSTNIPPIMIISRIHEHQNLLSL